MSSRFEFVSGRLEFGNPQDMKKVKKQHGGAGLSCAYGYCIAPPSPAA